MPLPLSPDAYDPLVNSTFAVALEGRALPVALTLTKVTRGRDDEMQCAFYLSFEGAGDLLPQATYRLTPAGRDPFDLFLVPFARTKTGYRYEASFNLLKNQD